MNIGRCQLIDGIGRSGKIRGHEKMRSIPSRCQQMVPGGTIVYCSPIGGLCLMGTFTLQAQAGALLFHHDRVRLLNFVPLLPFKAHFRLFRKLERHLLPASLPLVTLAVWQDTIPAIVHLNRHHLNSRNVINEFLTLNFQKTNKSATFW